ncbi:FAD-dependent oxidoreductase [Leucobacter sp. W1478]|uniref:FAD-dependent oxidoreductase n=1 Tax=Leucobacter sp. W1478 TaxID=3439065 RepID=UPI003F371D30
MTDSIQPQIAIVGSGPSGCYLAQALLRAQPESQITIIDRLVSPFGLIRYGVAADHQHTKAIIRQFERLFQSPNVRFAGNLEVGTDFTLRELRDCFDAVVLATGLAADRELALPGGNLKGVVGAGTITRALNSHPGDGNELPELGSDVVIIGAGNVALDILRFLVKDRGGYAASDVADPALEQYLSRPAERVTLVSRSGAVDSKGDPQMLKELAALERATYRSPDTLGAPDPALDRTQTARLQALTEMLSVDRPEYQGPRVDLRFSLTPVRVVGDSRVQGVEFTDGSQIVTIPATSVLTAIGFTAAGSGTLEALIAQQSETGRVEPGLYRTGWAKRGPRGAIPENRACAKSVSDEITADLQTGTLSASGDKLGFVGLPEAAQEKAISYAQWLVLDAFEREAASPDRVRRKVSDHDRMVAVARGEG